jgi:Tol biopolymer transport system component
MASRQALVPSTLERAVRKCLRKNPDDRWQTARDLLDELTWIAEGGTVIAAGAVRVRRGWRTPAAPIAAAVGLAAAGFLVLQPAAEPPSSSAVVRLSVLPPDGTSFTAQSASTVGIPQFELSPDGGAIVFAVAERGGRPSLWLRPLDSVVARALPGTEGAEFPFWSPDSRWVGFFADGRLKKVPIAGGPPRTIASDLPDYRPAAWGPDDTILLSQGYTGILRVAASGGTVTPVTELDASRQEGSHRYPQFLPDGRHFLFQVRSSLAEHTGVYVGVFDGTTKTRLIPGQTTARYASGHLFFLDSDILMRQPFDIVRLALTGEAVPAGEGVGRSSMGTGAYSLSTASTLAYAGTLRRPSRLAWFDRSGNPSGVVGAVGDYTDFRLAPDGTRLAASLVDGKTGFPDIWLTDLARGSTSRFTFGPAVNAGALWSRDGTRIVFRTTRSGGLQEFYAKSAGGGGSEEPVVPQSGMRVVTSNATLSDWSPDGRYLLFPAVGSSDWDLWVVSFAQGARPAAYLTAPGDQWHGNFSPDGRLVAYSSTESGRFEVYVQSFPLSDRQWTISTGGGYEPRWRADGREIYYLSADRKLMAVAVGAGPSFGPPTPLFQTGVAPGVHSQRTQYVPSFDGQRFLISTPVAEQAPTPITVVLNVATGGR